MWNGEINLDEFVCVTVRSRAGEAVDEFKARLIDFWTTMIRGRPVEYAQVYAETTQFVRAGDRLTRQYLTELPISELLAGELTAAGIDHEAIDKDDVYSKYEAASPEWFQIPH